MAKERTLVQSEQQVKILSLGEKNLYKERIRIKCLTSSQVFGWTKRPY